MQTYCDSSAPAQVGKGRYRDAIRQSLTQAQCTTVQSANFGLYCVGSLMTR